MSETDPDGTAHPESAGYQPKPPLWQPAPQPPAPRSHVVLAIAAFVVVAAVAVAIGETQFLTTPATETPLTIAAVESTAHADEHHPTVFGYRVRLPDGSSARFTSSQTYPPGTRLRAMVARGRITKRVIVSGPYVALPAE